MSKAPIILIICHDDTLEIVKHLHELQVAADNGCDLLWNNKGQVKLMPNAALKNALAAYSDWMQAFDLGHSPPKDALAIRWNQLKPSVEPYLVRTPTLPPLPLKPAESPLQSPPEPDADYPQDFLIAPRGWGVETVKALADLESQPLKLRQSDQLPKT